MSIKIKVRMKETEVFFRKTNTEEKFSASFVTKNLKTRKVTESTLEECTHHRQVWLAKCANLSATPEVELGSTWWKCTH